MNKISLFFLPLLFCISCDRDKPLSAGQKRAELSKDGSDIAEKLATGRDREAKEQLLDQYMSGKDRK
jgi:hypothetical protein